MNIEVDQSFNIKDIMECGQAFRYERVSGCHHPEKRRWFATRRECLIKKVEIEFRASPSSGSNLLLTL